MAPVKPTACLLGAASLHIAHLTQKSPTQRYIGITKEADELFSVFVSTAWLDVAAQGWPLIGLLHILQTQIEADIQDGNVIPDTSKLGYLQRWQPLESDDHMRFRNWVYSHLASGQTPPLVDSVHFLARADPREPREASRHCSAAKAMGYLATALAFAQEADMSTRNEARAAVESAEMHVKMCNAVEPTAFSVLPFLQTEWPLCWLLHTVLSHLEPQMMIETGSMQAAASAAVAALPPIQSVGPEAARAALQALIIKPPPNMKMPPASATFSAPVRQAAASSWASSSSIISNEPALLAIPVSMRAEFRDMGSGFFTVDIERLEEVLGVSPGRFVQLFRDGMPVRRASQGEAECSSTLAVDAAPFWSITKRWGRTWISLYDPDFHAPALAYAASVSAPRVIGLFSEVGSASDPYNAEWLQAYRQAAARMGITLQELSDPAQVHDGSIYFWRINQMFEGGRLAGQPMVGRAIAEYLQKKLEARGAILWPRPETMHYYQDKIALRALFLHTGVPAPKSWVVQDVDEFEALLQAGEISDQDFPVVLKHPFAASSRAMAGCNSLGEIRQILAAWLAEHRVPCLLQRRLRISRDLRVTYVGGEIVHSYWRLKPTEDALTTGTGQGGSMLDFNVANAELAPFVKDFATKTGIDIGAMDIAFLDGEGPSVFEVSPTFDLNPEPPAEWANKPYRDYKKTGDYLRRRAENYASCAERILSYALGRRGHLFVDIDNTVSASWERIRRAALPKWPGERFDSAKAFSPAELARDEPLPDAATSLRGLGREWEVTFITARNFKGAFEASEQWLRKHGFGFAARLVVVREPRDKLAWLEDAATEETPHPHRPGSRVRPFALIDDLSRGHHRAAVELDKETIGLLQQRGIPFEVFRIGETLWPQLAQRLIATALSPESLGRPTLRGRGLCDSGAS
eukprot:TRINITY_DN23756_c0_g1_i1.p1 TRINITY_DN23756_c0_g1~~TRINITY_DN23756_c0_g1_i1.p1  ORF type:complete len:1016 (+),score=178.31 TRINITY_DN23756_c0_g1_i1:292-3048(+)